VVRSQPRQIVPQDPISKNPSQKNRTGRMAQSKDPEFKHQYCKKKKKKKLMPKNKLISIY
jgi:hypothetical protein